MLFGAYDSYPRFYTSAYWKYSCGKRRRKEEEMGFELTIRLEIFLGSFETSRKLVRNKSICMSMSVRVSVNLFVRASVMSI